MELTASFACLTSGGLPDWSVNLVQFIIAYERRVSNPKLSEDMMACKAVSCTSSWIVHTVVTHQHLTTIQNLKEYLHYEVSYGIAQIA